MDIFKYTYLFTFEIVIYSDNPLLKSLIMLLLIILLIKTNIIIVLNNEKN